MNTKTKIINILASCDSYISGEEISSQFGISRTAVWKYIKKLRSEGYRIDSVTNKGYKLISSPDIVTPEDITSGLNTDFIAKTVYCYSSVESTNITAKQNSSAPDGTLFVADVQTAGRGRLGRAWKSPSGTGIWMSFLLKPNIELSKVSQITLIAGLCVCRCIKNLCGVDAKIKWPNDVVIGSKKVCGILTELSAEIDGVNYVVVGIGINVATESFDTELSEKATSLLIETGIRYKRADLIRCIAEEFEKYYTLLISKGFTAIKDDYESVCVNIGKDVFVIKDGESRCMKCLGVSDSGGLIVQSDNNQQEILSGEVSVRGIYGYV